jgi:diamine N-acetyltransferase
VVSLRPVTRENVRAVCELELADHQARLVAPAAFTVAEGHYEPGALLRAVYAADTGRTLHGEPVFARALG